MDLIVTSCICITVFRNRALFLSLIKNGLYANIMKDINQSYYELAVCFRHLSENYLFLSFPVYLWHLFQGQQRDAFVQERYGQYDLRDPFIALLRDSELSQAQDDGGQSPVCLNPLGVLKLVMAHCTNMKEKMMKQLAAAERRHRRVRDREIPELHT